MLSRLLAQSRPLAWAAALALAALSSRAAAQQFTVIGLPDTQNYSEFYPAIFHQQTQWIADHADELGIRFVSQWGDLVNHGGDLAEWAVADSAMSTLDVLGVPYGACAGNHDATPSGGAGTPYDPSNFVQFFGPGRFADAPWYGGASPAGTSSYQVFSAGGIDLLYLHVEIDAPLRELEWAQGVLNQNRDKPVMLATHRYLQDAQAYTGGVPLVPSGHYPDVWYEFEGTYAPDGLHTEQIWDWFVRRNPNVFLVTCGHFHGQFHQVSTNASGKPVHEMLADYQDDPNGGNGFLRILAFDLAAQRIDVRTYSPTLDQYKTTAKSQFSLPLNIADYHSTHPTVVLQEGIAGYVGTQDTWIDQSKPNVFYGEDPERVSDDDVTNSIFTDKQGQALIRFDGLIGGGANQVPPGAQVLSAWLTIQLSDDIDNPLFDPDFLVYRVLIPWSETSTWNSLGNGLQLGELAGPVAIFIGDNDPNGDGMRRINVTAAAQAWANGAPNFGFAILPEIIPGNDDGISILTSESGNKLLRPSLSVTYAFQCGYDEYGLGMAKANSMSLHGVGSAAVGGTVTTKTTLAPPTGVLSAWSAAPAEFALFGGVTLLDPAQVGSLAFAPSVAGTAIHSTAVPAQPALAGASFCFQSFALDAAQPLGIALSNGLRVTLCQ